MDKSSGTELAYPEYWDARYDIEDKKIVAADGPYEWFRNFTQLHDFFQKYLPTAVDNPSILHLGCGLSSLTNDLFLQGYANQCSIDFSSVAIKTMREKHRDLATLEWREMDVRKMDFNNASFDVTIDKGTLDAMLYGSLWNPEEQVQKNAKAYIDEVARILKPGGVWLYITYRQPHFMRPLLQRDGVWSLDVNKLEDGPGTFEYFGFVMKKHANE